MTQYNQTAICDTYFSSTSNTKVLIKGSPYLIRMFALNVCPLYVDFTSCVFYLLTVAGRFLNREEKYEVTLKSTIAIKKDVHEILRDESSDQMRRNSGLKSYDTNFP
ncbi:hypothetical protein ACF0H5_005765 [Mactra antiquata]